MASLSLEQVFGSGVTQNSNFLIIQKSSLLGLNAVAANSAVVLLAAIIATANQQIQGNLTDENNNNITDEKGIPISYDHSQYYITMNILFWGVILTSDKKIRSVFIFNLSQLA